MLSQEGNISTFVRFLNECAKFSGSRAAVGLVNLKSSCLREYFKKIFSWLFRGSKFFFSWVFRGCKYFSCGYFVDPKFFLVGILWVQFFLVGIS